MLPPFYELLGVGEDASAQQVRAAFKQRAVQLHPDKGGDPALFAALREAYDTLADPERRAEYDRDVAKGGDADGEGMGRGRAVRGNAELDMLRRFREAEEYAGKDPTELQALKQTTPVCVCACLSVFLHHCRPLGHSSDQETPCSIHLCFLASHTRLIQ